MILPSLDEQIRGGKLARWVHEVQTADEIWDEVEPEWVADEKTREVTRKGGYVVRDSSKPPTSREHVDRLVRERLRPLVAGELRQFQSRAVERPNEASALVNLYLAEIEELRNVASQSPLLSGVPSVASALDDLSSSLRRAVRMPNGTPSDAKGSSPEQTPKKKRVGNPDWDRVMDDEQRARLYVDWVQLLKEEPETYQARTTGNVSDNAKHYLGDKYGVSASTVKRYIEDEKERRGA